MSACSRMGWVVGDGILLMTLLTNEIETWKHLELSESKNNYLPVTNVKYRAAFSTDNFYNALPPNIFENLHWQNENASLSGV